MLEAEDAVAADIDNSSRKADDLVDRTGADSFPASDPPAWIGTHAGAPAPDGLFPASGNNRSHSRSDQIMTTRTLSKVDWQPYFNRVANALVGKQASVEILSPALGAQWTARRLPLLGITYDAKGDLIEIAMDGLDHLVRHPRDVRVDEQPTGLASLEIAADDGSHQIVMLDSPLLLPTA